MSRRRKEIKEAEPEENTARKNKALMLALMMILAVGLPSAIAAYYVYNSSHGGIIDPGDNPDDGDGGGTPGDGGNPPTVRNHMVIGEVFVTTECPYCAVAEKDLKGLENERNDFYFVSMVADKNQDAYNRYYEISKQQGTPDTEFDGGRRGELGAVDVDKYVSDIEYCKGVAVYDVRIGGSASAVDSSHISVSLSISVPDGDFNGHVRAFVVEKTSRYTNSAGDPIPNAFLGYAVNEDFSISASSQYHKTVSWEGDYGNADNIAIIIAVYDSNGMGVNAYRISL